MASEIFTKKMDLLFNSLDLTHDGVIDRSDANQVIDQVAGGATSPGGEADFRAVTERFWITFATMNASGGYGIDQATFRSAMVTHMLHGNAFNLVLGPVAERWFGLYDSDHDGAITFSEYAQWLGFRGADPNDLKQGFDHLDRNGDGLLGREEWMQGLREYCTSDDPNTAGNFLLGPLA